MTIDLQNLAHRPAASITDQEVSAAIEVMTSDPRVTKAVHVGREDGAADGRQLIDFEMTGFAGVHSLGRCISALGEDERSAAKAAAKNAKVAKKEAADQTGLLALVPAPGKNRPFDKHLDSLGMTNLQGDERATAYAEYMLPRLEGLTGSLKQRVWAADIRIEMTSSDLWDRAAIFKKFKSAKFWIDNRSNFRIHDHFKDFKTR
jgi:hypothetical protein